ncbi:MAG: nitrile hydratase subunit alpha [bacterium]|nr:nitrile hydratase subunit alpha [bacterium]
MTRRVDALVARLAHRGLVTDAAIAETIESFLTHAKPSNGFRIVARAWSDDAFRARLLDDANAAVAELGIDLSHWAPVTLRVVENTADVHNMIVCTLCSCYPIALLGPSPAWYKSAEYRARAVSEPRAVLAEFGVELPERTRIRVWDSTSEMRYLVLPRRPAGSDGLDEQRLATLVTRNGLIGTALV